MTNWQPTSPLARIVDLAGFAYDPDQDIIYSTMDALQRNLGYAYGYDAAALPMQANLDCEPIFFQYGGKLWMIELRKGQYGLETGGEIGVYNRSPNPPSSYLLLDETIGTRPVDPDPTHGVFFQCAADDELLPMSFTLLRAGVPLFQRALQSHWWLTGFKWGIYSTPADLVMDITIGFPNADMCQAFVQALQGMGYTCTVTGLTVTFQFASPRAPQPPQDPTILEGVESAAAALVQTYAGLHLPNNDPNQVPAAAVNEIVLAVLARTPDQFGRIMGKGLKAIGQTAENVAGLFVNDLECPLESAAAWITDTGYALADWVESVYSVVNATFGMNFSSAVEIVNVVANGQSPPLLTLTGSGITLTGSGGVHGSWFVPPPLAIAPGDTRRIYLKDNVGIYGSSGWAQYAYIDSNGAQQSVGFSFACPTDISHNTASANPSYKVYASSGASGSWQPSVPDKGHPLNVAFVWANGPAPT